MKDTNTLLALAGLVAAAWPAVGVAQQPYPPYTPTTKELRAQEKPGQGERLDDLERRVTALEGYLAESFNQAGRGEAAGWNGTTARAGVPRETVPVQGQDPEEMLGGYHTIQEGETLHTIANAYGVSLDDLVATNQLDPYGPIYVGDDLWIPGSLDRDPSPGRDEGAAGPAAEWSSSYQVKSGDTLHSIARRLGVSPEEIAHQNRLADVNQIYVGQMLMLPANGVTGGGAPPVQAGETASVASAEPVEESYHYYHVVPGDSLSGIAETFFTTEEELRRLNELSGHQIQVGQRLVVPTSRYFEHLRSQRESPVS